MRDEYQNFYHMDGHGGEHTHVQEDGTVITHSHGHGHTHTQTKAVLNRLSRAIGHLEYVKRMVEEGQDCTDVLIQIAAVRSALNNTAKIILKDHMEHCITDEHTNQEEQIELLNDAINKFF